MTTCTTDTRALSTGQASAKPKAARSQENQTTLSDASEAPLDPKVNPCDGLIYILQNYVHGNEQRVGVTSIGGVSPDTAETLTHAVVKDGGNPGDIGDIHTLDFVAGSATRQIAVATVSVGTPPRAITYFVEHKTLLHRHEDPRR